MCNIFCLYAYNKQRQKIMEDDQSKDLETTKEKPTSSIKIFSFGAFAMLVIVLLFLAYSAHQESERKRKGKEALDKYKIEHQGFVNDSLIKVQIEKDKFASMKFFIHKMDSVKKTVRFKPGDLVYLKPDSTKGVINHLNIDSSFIFYDYSILFISKDGRPVLEERKDFLIY